MRSGDKLQLSGTARFRARRHSALLPVLPVGQADGCVSARVHRLGHSSLQLLGTAVSVMMLPLHHSFSIVLTKQFDDVMIFCWRVLNTQEQAKIYPLGPHKVGSYNVSATDRKRMQPMVSTQNPFPCLPPSQRQLHIHPCPKKLCSDDTTAWMAGPK